MPGKYTSLINCADGLACWTHQNGAKYGQDHAKSRFADGKLCLWSKGLPTRNRSRAPNSPRHTFASRW